jgi:hypothetical protein
LLSFFNWLLYIIFKIWIHFGVIGHLMKTSLLNDSSGISIISSYLCSVIKQLWTFGEVVLLFFIFFTFLCCPLCIFLGWISLLTLYKSSYWVTFSWGLNAQYQSVRKKPS